MELTYAKRLVAHLSHNRYEPTFPKAIADDLGVPEHERDEFVGLINEMAGEGKLRLDKRGRVTLPAVADEIVGSFRKNPRGFGFVIPESAVLEGDVFIPPHAVGDALTGDRVRIAVTRKEKYGEVDVTGEIIEVVERRRGAFTGELDNTGGVWVVYPDGREMTEPISVSDAESKNAQPGDKVVVEIVRYPSDGSMAEGVITRVLGASGEPDVETEATIAAFALPSREFPEACVEQARQATATFDEAVRLGETDGFPDRLDLRDEFICTIDPPDAKDYDDAISITRDGRGWQLGVHIADVSHFVRRGSPLDLEAIDRANSTYLPRLVIPMLPEILSNGICSLAEGVTRFCKSCFMTYDEHGRVGKTGLASTVIKSRKRLTYLEAQALIDGNVEEAKKHAKTEPEYSDELIDAIKNMDRLARAIRDRRRKAGMIHLELPDAELIFDETGRVIDAEPEDDAFTHTIIEMFMVEANEVLARTFERLDTPLIRRVHPEPPPGDVEDFRQVSMVAGYRIPKNPSREELQGLLDSTAGTGAARAVHMAVLRMLTKAEYSPARIGHFALASEAYSHFTSPIRRYADLTVHRALAELLELTKNGAARPDDEQGTAALTKKLRDQPDILSEQELVEIGRQCTMREQNAEGAERSLREFLVLQLLESHIGEEFPGVVTGVSPRGAFVQLDKYLAEGFVKTSDLVTGDGRMGGRWVIDKKTGGLIHPESGATYRAGDTIRVRIAEIELSVRRMTLAISDPNARAAGKRKPAGELTSGGLGGGGLGLNWDDIKGGGKTGAQKRAQRSRSRDQAKADYRRPGKNNKKKKKR